MSDDVQDIGFFYIKRSGNERSICPGKTVPAPKTFSFPKNKTLFLGKIQKMYKDS
ncbi:MAG: hypothetical protein Q4D16_09745 [Eubacteriales bacterium]|nr:hypothetical protein [Eubacteriales bacterium]